jgi:hypothetical protein
MRRAGPRWWRRGSLCGGGGGARRRAHHAGRASWRARRDGRDRARPLDLRAVPFAERAGRGAGASGAAGRARRAPPTCRRHAGADALGPARCAAALAARLRSARIFRPTGRGSEVYCTVDLAGPEDFNPTSPVHLGALERTGRRLAHSLTVFLRAHHPAFARAEIAAFPTRVGIRESCGSSAPASPPARPRASPPRGLSATARLPARRTCGRRSKPSSARRIDGGKRRGATCSGWSSLPRP